MSVHALITRHSESSQSGFSLHQPLPDDGLVRSDLIRLHLPLLHQDEASSKFNTRASTIMCSCYAAQGVKGLPDEGRTLCV